MHKKVLYFQTKFLAEKKADSINIEGFASTGDVDRVKDKVLPTAFTETLPMFLKNPVMLLQHDDNKVIGQFTDGNIKSNGLQVRGEVMYDIDNCMQKILDGVLGAFSIGFITLAYQYEDEQGHVIYRSDEGLQAGYEWDDLYRDDVIRIITKVDLVEVSIVSTPANPYALFQVAKDFFVEETKALKAFAMQKKGAPNEEETKVENEEKVETTEVKEAEEVKEEETPNETPNTTTEEVISGETPEIVEEVTPPIDTTVEEGKSEDVEAVENPTETPINGISEEKAKDLIAEAVNLATKELSKSFEFKLSEIAKENSELKSALSDQEKKYTKLEKEVLNIEIAKPSSFNQKSTTVRQLTDEDILQSIGLRK
jgi:HK97 family phage prohead protease